MELSDVEPSLRVGNVAKLFDQTAAHHGDAVAIEHHGSRTTHRDLQDESATFAGGLRDLGLDPGDCLLVYLPNRPEYLIAALGAFRAGVIVSPVNPQYKRREVAYQLEDADADVVLTHPSLRPVVADACAETDRDPIVITVDEAAADDRLFADVRGEPTLVQQDDSNVALLPYTSGTTGRPKGVRLTHRNFRAQLFSSLTSTTTDLDAEAVRSLIWLPLYHITGFTHTACQPLVRGGGLFLRSAANWDAEACLELIESAGITHFVGVTAMYVDMVETDALTDYDLTSLEVAGEGGAKMSQAVQRTFEKTAGIEMSEGYGLTETTGATHSQTGSTFGLKHGTIGQPLRMVDAKIVNDDGNEVPIGEEGELLVRGPQVMREYHDRPQATEAAFTEDGFFRTGDVATRDENNYYEIVDRKKHVIVTAGYNVYPSEVEELLAEHAAVSEAAIVGIDDERRNEIPVAFVVPAPGTEPGTDVSAADIKRYCLDAAAEYKHPREVHFVDELPRTTSGKIQKFKLVQRHEGLAGE